MCVASHVLAGETQSDWLIVRYDDGTTPRAIELNAGREKSMRVNTTLAAGATAWTRWDLAAWAKRDGRTLSAGPLWVNAVYDSTRETDAWAGQLSAAATITVP